MIFSGLDAGPISGMMKKDESRPRAVLKYIKTLKNPIVMNAIIRYFKEAYAEMRKVVWPSRKETINHTVLVIAISVGVAAFMGIADYCFILGLERIIK